MFTLTKNIPMIFYYTTTLANHETSQDEGKETLIKLVHEDWGSRDNL